MIVNKNTLVHRFMLLLDKVAGADDTFAMEHRIFNCAIAVSLASLVPAVVFVLFQGQFLVAAGLFVACMAYGYIYYLCRYANKLQQAVLLFSVAGAALLNGMWIVDRGPHGSTPYFIFIVLLMIIFTAEQPLRYVAVVTINVITISIVDGPIQAAINWQMPPDPLGQLVSLVVAVLFLALLAIMYRNLISRKSQEKLLAIVQQLQNESSQMNRVADNLVSAGDDLSASAMGQKSAVEQLLVTTEELGATAGQNDQQAGESIRLLNEAERYLLQSRENADKLLASMTDIRRSSDEIQHINNVVNDIAWQTNLLSLNAMIEASRAGEGNGGFKVVAQEVKKLAERSAQAADNINRLLADNRQSVENGVQLSDEMQRQFDAVAEQIKPLSDAVHNTSDASREQTQAISQITQGLADIDRTVGHNQQTAGQTAETAAELRNNAQTLLDIVQQLREEL